MVAGVKAPEKHQRLRGESGVQLGIVTEKQLDLGFHRVLDRPLLDLSAVPWCAQEARPRPSLVFPTVVNIGALFASARERDRPGAGAGMPDQYFMYFAPHHSSGMGLAIASHPEGPWAPYPHNPILRLEDAPGLRDHISAAEFVYRPDQPEEPFWLYFHGVAQHQSGTQQSCVASSADGIHWRVLSPDPVLPAAYAQIFKRGDWYYALHKRRDVHCLARSRDGLAWESWPHNPIIKPEASEGEFGYIRHTAILVEGDTVYFFYCTVTREDQSREEIKLATISVAGDDWLQWGSLRRHGVVFAPELPWEKNDVRDPFLFRSGDSLYLYYSGGHEEGIGLAKTSGDVLKRVPV